MNLSILVNPSTLRFLILCSLAVAQKYPLPKEQTRMGQAQRALHARCIDGPAALGPSYDYFVPLELPEFTNITRPGSGNLTLRLFKAE